MAVRNFWVEADIDGRATTLAGGPKSKEGGLQLVVYQRDKGGIKKAFTINCIAGANGNLAVQVMEDGKLIRAAITQR